RRFRRSSASSAARRSPSTSSDPTSSRAQGDRSTSRSCPGPTRPSSATSTTTGSAHRATSTSRLHARPHLVTVDRRPLAVLARPLEDDFDVRADEERVLERLALHVLNASGAADPALREAEILITGISTQTVSGREIA